MNDPNDVPIAVQDEIAWLDRYRREGNRSWSDLARETGIPQGTLSQLLSGNYKGNLDNQARRIFQFRQKVSSQTARSNLALARPRHIDTPTGKHIQFLLEVAHLGNITAVATGPGTGKTMEAEHYKASMGETVWLVTMRQSTGSLAAMIDAVMKAMKLDMRTGWTRQRSAQVTEHVKGRRGLIIVDEANHCEWAALEELRGWHDETGVGIALLANEELMTRIRGSANRHQYARLSSRISNYHIQDMPVEGDVRAYLDAMDIDDADTIREMVKAAMSPGNGGLREVRQILQSANMLAIGADTALGHEHVMRAMNMRATQQLRHLS